MLVPFLVLLSYVQAVCPNLILVCVCNIKWLVINILKGMGERLGICIIWLIYRKIVKDNIYQKVGIGLYIFFLP